jgi:hypothetical protein
LQPLLVKRVRSLYISSSHCTAPLHCTAIMLKASLASMVNYRPCHLLLLGGSSYWALLVLAGWQRVRALVHRTCSVWLTPRLRTCSWEAPWKLNRTLYLVRDTAWSEEQFLSGYKGVSPMNAHWRTWWAEMGGLNANQKSAIRPGRKRQKLATKPPSYCGHRRCMMPSLAWFKRCTAYIPILNVAFCGYPKYSKPKYH